jgi:hypothetical protein
MLLANGRAVKVLVFVVVKADALCGFDGRSFAMTAMP